MVAEGADIIDVGGESTRPGRGAGARGRGARAASCRSSSGWRRRARADLDRHLQGRRRARGDRSAARPSSTTSAACIRPGLAAAVGGDRRRAGPDAQPRQVAGDVPRGCLRRRDRRDRAELRGGDARRRSPPASAASRSSSIPGFGFAKRAEHTYAALADLDRLARPRSPDPVGTFAQVVPERGARRRPADGARLGHRRGRHRQHPLGAHIVRVHNVRGMVDVARVADRIRAGAGRRRHLHGPQRC